MNWTIIFVIWHLDYSPKSHRTYQARSFLLFFGASQRQRQRADLQRLYDRWASVRQNANLEPLTPAAHGMGRTARRGWDAEKTSGGSVRARGLGVLGSLFFWAQRNVNGQYDFILCMLHNAAHVNLIRMQIFHRVAGHLADEVSEYEEKILWFFFPEFMGKTRHAWRPSPRGRCEKNPRRKRGPLELRREEEKMEE